MQNIILEKMDIVINLIVFGWLMMYRLNRTNPLLTRFIPERRKKQDSDLYAIHKHP